MSVSWSVRGKFSENFWNQIAKLKPQLSWAVFPLSPSSINWNIKSMGSFFYCTWTSCQVVLRSWTLLSSSQWCGVCTCSGHFLFSIGATRFNRRPLSPSPINCNRKLNEMIYWWEDFAFVPGQAISSLSDPGHCFPPFNCVGFVHVLVLCCFPLVLQDPTVVHWVHPPSTEIDFLNSSHIKFIFYLTPALVVQCFHACGNTRIQSQAVLSRCLPHTLQWWQAGALRIE